MSDPPGADPAKIDDPATSSDPVLEARIRAADLDAKLADLALKRSDLRLRRIERALKRHELTSRSGLNKYISSPLAPVVVTAFAGFMVAQITGVVQNRANIDLEREKLKSSLFLKAIDTSSSEASARNLLFLSDLKMIDDPYGKIAALKDNPQKAPYTGGGAGFVPRDASSIAKFFEQYRAAFGPTNQSLVGNLEQILSFISTDTNIKDMRQVAYILATVKWETANTFNATMERCGNTTCLTGEDYKGRGYIQLTGRENYDKIGKIIGVDLLNQPALEMQPLIAYRSASVMMIDGLVTGKKLGDFIDKNKKDYVNARKVVNGATTHAARIAADAEKLEEILRASLPAATP